MSLRLNPDTGEYEDDGAQSESPYPGYHWDDATQRYIPDNPVPSTGPGPNWDKYTPFPTPTTPTPAAPTVPTGGGDTPPDPTQFAVGPLLGMPDLPNVPDAPLPDLPIWKTPAPFTAPSPEEALNDPGYKFRLGQGLDALQRWAAAKGTLNDTGTAKGLMDYGQNAGSQEYGNVWNRAMDTYNTNYRTQYVDPYTHEYQRGMDLWKPAFDTWMTRNDFNRLGYTTTADWNKHMNDLAYQNAWTNRKNYLDWGTM